MKTKKLSKKLGLNKITIAQLNDMDLTNIKGGAIYTSIDICATCQIWNCSGSGGTSKDRIIIP